MSGGRTKEGKAPRLTRSQQLEFLDWVETTAYPLRNRVIALLSFECCCRATEIARACWSMAFDPYGRLRSHLKLPKRATKGGYGARELYIDRDSLGAALLELRGDAKDVDVAPSTYMVTFRKKSNEPVMRSKAVQAFFRQGFNEIDLPEASSHSGRRTGITLMARAQGLENAQEFAGHRDIATTAGYVDPDHDAIDRVVREQLVVRGPRLLGIRPRMLKVDLAEGSRSRTKTRGNAQGNPRVA